MRGRARGGRGGEGGEGNADGRTGQEDRGGVEFSWVKKIVPGFV